MYISEKDIRTITELIYKTKDELKNRKINKSKQILDEIMDVIDETIYSNLDARLSLSNDNKMTVN